MAARPSDIFHQFETCPGHSRTQRVFFPVSTFLIFSISDHLLSNSRPGPLRFPTDSEDFALVAGINKLQALAKLPSIAYTVPVSFVLTFQK